jgi:hypothetical protein
MPTDPVVDENVLGRTTAKVQESIKQAFMGYFSVNLFDLPSGFKFGVFNDRQAKSVQITKLLESFRTEGLLHCDRQTAIPVGLHGDWISSNPIMEPKEGDIGSVESITFTPNRQKALNNKQVIVFGGNHRRLAIKKHIDGLASRRQELDKQLKKLPPLEQRDEAQVAKADNLRWRIGKIDEVFEKSKLWLIVAYDLGAYKT